MTQTYPWSSLGALLRERATRHPERELFRFEGVSRTYGEMEEATNRLANVLRARGIGRGDRVALMMPNGLDFPTCWLALVKVGAVMVPINTQYRDKDLEYVLRDSGAIMALASPDCVGQIESVRARSALREIAVLQAEGPAGTSALASEIETAEGEVPLEPFRLDDLMSIQYTSGTTGFPKGCMLSHRFMVRMGAIPAAAFDLTERDVMLTAQPFYYLDPQWSTSLCMIAGCPLVILPRFSASSFWRSVRENGVTFFYVLGTMPVYLYKQPADPGVEKGHRVRLAVCSGIPRELHAAFEQRWNVPWREAYGSTESGVDLIVRADEGDSVGTGRMGRAVQGRDAKVVDASGRGVPNGEPGELWLRGEGMMLGYWNQPEATAEKLRDGWLHTGDLVIREATGHFTMVGRTKDMIRRTGENIAAAEVESVLLEHPAVQAAAVVPVPDELRGEEVKAFIQLQPGIRPEATPPLAIVEFVRTRLAAFKAPRFIEYVDRMPLTASEKVAKHELLRRKTDQRVGAYDVTTQRWG